MANRQYKDTVFRTYFNHKSEIAQLYQAIRPDEVILPDDITITTLDDVFLSARKNDLSFLWKDQAIVLAEQQSSLNPNMPYLQRVPVARGARGQQEALRDKAHRAAGAALLYALSW